MIGVYTFDNNFGLELLGSNKMTATERSGRGGCRQEYRQDKNGTRNATIRILQAIWYALSKHSVHAR